MRDLTRPASSPLYAVVLAALTLALALASEPPAHAQDLPPCGDAANASRCILPAWPDAALAEVPSPFGPVVGRVWAEDAEADVAPGGLDIRAVGIGSVEISDPRSVRRLDSLLKRGRAKRAVRAGPAHVVRIVLDRPVSEIAEGHAGVHVVTDIDDARSNDAPAGSADPDSPWAGWQDVYSLTYATTTAESRLLDSDLADRWYRDKDFFAAAWASPTVLDVLVRPNGLGPELAVVTHVSGIDGGYDVAALGPNPIPVDGRVGLLPRCTEASLSVEPFSVARLVENGQTLRDVNVPASWQGGASMPVDDEERAAIEALVAALDEDGDGRIGLAAQASVVEGGLIIRQRPELQLALADGGVQLALQLGLTQRGYNVLRDVVPDGTGDALADAWLEEATRAMVDAMAPFRSTRRGGPLQGGSIGSCVPALIAVPSADPEPVPTATSSADGLDDAAADALAPED